MAGARALSLSFLIMFGLGWVHEAFTIRRTSGRTRSSTGNAIAHDVPQALIHAAVNPGSSPRLFAVATPETMPDMNIERISGVRKAP